MTNYRDANDCPIPDAAHTLLVDSTGTPVTGRSAKAGDTYAQPPLPYHYAAYFQPKRYDDTTDLDQLEREDRALLDLAILDLSQTPSGRAYLQFAWDNNFKFGHDPGLTSTKGVEAIYYRKTKTLWLRSGGTRPSLQLTGKHEIGHEFRNELGLLYGNWDSLASGLKVVRAQEASSIVDEAEHAVECEMITDPNHYQPQGVMSYLLRYRPEVANAALEAMHFFVTGEKDKFRQAVHIAFYTQEQLAYYDEGVIDYFASLMPTPEKPSFEKAMSSFMTDNPEQTHETLAAILPYLKTANYSLDDPRFVALSDTPEVTAKYEVLCRQIEQTIAGTDFKPRYRLEPETQPMIDVEIKPGFFDWGRPAFGPALAAMSA